LSNSQPPKIAGVSRNIITKLFGCATIEQCQNIQKGSVIFRRISQWIALCSLGITFSIGYWINHFQGKAITYINEYDQLVSSKTIKWFYDAPSIQWIRDLIGYYSSIEKFHTFILIIITVLTVRWIYADSIVRGNGIRGFWIELGLILLVNFLIYTFFSSIWFYDFLLKI